MPRYQVSGPSVFVVGSGQPTYGTNGPPAAAPPSPEALKRAARRSKVRIAMASVIACLGSMALGFNGAYSSPAIPNINKHRSPFHMNHEQQSWFISVGFFTAIIGSFLTGILIDRAGRKLSLMLTVLPFVTGWVLIAGAHNVYMMYAGRLMSGFSAALTLSVVSVYIAEIAPPHIRGLLMSFHEIFLNFGILVIYLIGSYIRYNWLAIMCVLPPVILTCCMIPMPESPRWLLMKGRREEAAEALQWLRGGKVDVSEEISRIQSTMSDSASSKMPWSAYFRAPLLRRLVISQMLFVLQEFSGINVVRAYTVSIFQSGGSRMNPNTQTVIVGAMMLAGSLFCTLIVDRLPRRFLLMGSSSAMAASMAAMGTFYFVRARDRPFAMAYLSWLPLVCLVVLVFAYPVGLGPMPFIITNELFPTRARGRACSMGIATLCLCGFVTTKFFVNIRLLVGDYGNFWGGGAICFLATVFTFLFVPETKGKSLEELEKSLQEPDKGEMAKVDVVAASGV